MSTSLLEARKISIRYQKERVVDSVSFTIEPKQLVAIIGPNGAGKSSLLKGLLGLVPLQSGTVTFFGKPLKSAYKRVGYTPQKEVIDWQFPVTVWDVVMMGRYANIGLFKRPRKEDKVCVTDCLEKVGMSKYANEQIGSLSGGQQQRVFLARALAQESDLYLMDEPFAGVDSKTEKAMILILKDLRDLGKTILVVHHDLSTVQAYYDHCLLINKRLIAAGDTPSVFNEANLSKTFEGFFPHFHP